MPGGQVRFTSQDKGGASLFAWIGADGSYQVRGCPAGVVKITVLPLERSRGGPGIGNPRGAARAKGSQKHRKPPAIPLRYTDATTTDLEYAVVAGSQLHDIELKP
jgi:hypothetical protein